MSLEKYHKKRKFINTPEPKGRIKKTKGQLLFVVQKHQASHLHYDFRLESEGVLKSWAIPKGPSLDPKNKRFAKLVENHPLDYRDFEGIIPEGNYGAGEVIIWDEGTYTITGASSRKEAEKLFKQQFKKGDIKITLYGKKLHGDFALVSMRHSQNDWLLIKKQDDFATKTDITKKNKSVRSGKTVESLAPKQEIKKNISPKKIKPMLATLIDQPFSDKDWIFEIKWDGYRAIAELDKGAVALYSRNFESFNDDYPQIVKDLQQIKHQAIIDGEVVVLNKKGIASFQDLQSYRADAKGYLAYYAFDLLELDGRDLKKLPLIERKKLLKKILPKKGRVKFSDHLKQTGEDFFKVAESKGLEGIIGKKASSTYKPGTRTEDWLKIKTHLRQEAVVAGFTMPQGSRKHFGSLVVGAYKDDELIPIGHVGGGFNDKKLKEIFKILNQLKQKQSPFKTKFKVNGEVHWVKPKIVVEIRFSNWTKDNLMRAPIFMGIREDKNPKDVAIDMPKKSAGAKILKAKNNQNDFSNLDKIFWPKEGYTKGDLIDYYKKIAPYILPYLKDRPESLNRHPDGIEGENFFQKDVSDLNLPKYASSKIIHSKSEDKNIKYLLCQNQETLLFMANLGCIEINPWNSRSGNLGKPDYLIIDLDPEDIGFDAIIKVALEINKILKSAAIKSYPKTSGARGLHIYIPLGGKYTYKQAKQFCEIIVSIAHQKLPSITSIERSPSKRKGKVYLDYLQNKRGATLAAPYSVRPKQGATVATPLRWNEVKKGLTPKKFTIKTIFKRLNRVGDLFKPVIGKGIDLEKSLSKLKKLYNL